MSSSHTRMTISSTVSRILCGNDTRCIHHMRLLTEQPMLFDSTGTSSTVMQAAAFNSWVEAVHASRHNRQVLAKALKRITNLKLSQAFDWWRHQAEALRTAHARAGQIICRMQRGSLASAFDSWADAVLDSQQAATQQEELVHAALAKGKTLLLRRGLAVTLHLIAVVLCVRSLLPGLDCMQLY